LGWKGPLQAIQSNPSAVSRDVFLNQGILRDLSFEAEMEKTKVMERFYKRKT